MSFGSRPNQGDQRSASDTTAETVEEKKSWLLTTTIIRGVFFLLALGFTCTSLIYLNAESDWHVNIIYGACMIGTVLISFMGMMRGTVFDNLTLILVAMIFLSVIRFEYREDLRFLKNPEQVRDSTVVAMLPGLDSVKVIRFRDARVVVSDTVILQYDDDYSSSQVLAPVCDTWRDSTRGDSVYAFAVGYAYDADYSTLMNDWFDTCRVATLLWESGLKEFYRPMVERWKTKTGRSVVSDPAFVTFTCLPGLNDGQEAWGVIGVYFVMLIPWIILISIVRGVSALLRRA